MKKRLIGKVIPLITFAILCSALVSLAGAWEIDPIDEPTPANCSVNEGIHLMWTGYPYPGIGDADVHNDLAKIAGLKMGIPVEYYSRLGQLAGQPDDPNFSDYTVHPSETHYAHTLPGMRTAPEVAEYYANKARTYIKNGDPDNGYIQLAYAMHFMSDMGCPYHYTYEGLLNHPKYEGFVGDNWHNGHYFFKDIRDADYYYSISDVSDAANNLANVAHQYQSYFDSQIWHNSNWKNDPKLVEDTRTVLIYAERYDRGLVDYVNR
jgi:hypothetical protein